jgi:aryl-alcohol dehydrogenase-like predicted oxidoreductase
MERIRLSNSDLTVSRIILGCEPLGGTDWGKVDTKDAIDGVHRALDLGINAFDTAAVYGLGKSEEVLSKALGERRHHVIIITKIGLSWSERESCGRAEVYSDCSPSTIQKTIETSLRRLRLDCIPLCLIHRPDPKTPIVETLEAIDKARQSGKLRYVGLSNFPADLIEQASRFVTLTAVQAELNLISRKAELQILPLCNRLGIGFLAYGPLAQGLLTGKYRSSSAFSDDDRRHRLLHFQSDQIHRHWGKIERLSRLAESYGKTIPQVAIRWVLESQAVSCAIAGAKNPKQVEDNIGSMDWEMSKIDREWLSKEDSNLSH